jgi:hypothetical protein
VGFGLLYKGDGREKKEQGKNGVDAMCLMPLTDEMEGNVSRRVMVYHDLLSPLVEKENSGWYIHTLPT